MNFYEYLIIYKNFYGLYYKFFKIYKINLLIKIIIYLMNFLLIHKKSKDHFYLKYIKII